MSAAKERLQAAIKDTLSKEKIFFKEELSAVQERYKFLDSKLRDATLIQAATEYFTDLQDQEDERVVIDSFIAGALFSIWRATIAKTV